MLVFIREDFNLDLATSALVTTVFSLAYGIAQLPAGWLADHIGRKVLLAVGILGVALAGILVGLATSFMVFLIFLGLMGVAGGGYHPSATPMISASVDPKKRGRMLGIHNIGGNSAFFISPLIAAAIARSWGWQASFLILAVPTTIFGIVFFWLLRRQKAGDQSTTAEHTSQAEEALAPGSTRRLIIFMCLVVFGGGVAGSIQPFLPLYFVDDFHLSKAVAASLFSVVNSAGLWAAVLGGYISDRIGRLPVITGTYLLTGVTIILYGLVPWGAGFIALLFLSGIGGYLRMPVMETFLITNTSPKRRSTIYGIYYFANLETGAIIAPILGAYLVEPHGYQIAFMVVGALVIAVTLVGSMLLWRNRDKDS